MSPNRAVAFRTPSWLRIARESVNRTCRGNSRIELDLSKGALVIGHILLQDGGQRFGLLWAQVDTLEIPHFHLALRLLLHSAKDQEKIPDIYPHLHAVGIGLAIIRRIEDCEIGLRR